jgi:aspartyl-tRNA(Asn)/glutamyl-tRNA(Gln) amidotransferase subunit A
MVTSDSTLPLHWQTAAGLGKAFQTRALSPVDYIKHLLARIETLDPKLNVFIRLDGDAALEAARVAGREIATGRPRGPLHGVPVGIKDIIDVAGLPTTCHSKILVDNVAASDSASVAKLRQAGAIIIGKVATHEFATGGPSFDLPWPPARNPWNRDHHPGGSSSGSGAGVAAGFFPLALGTDTGGSVRNPASACGIVGLKPTYGLVSRRGVFPLAFTLDHVGPMTRTVEDNALLLDAIAGYDPADAGSSAAPVRGSYAADLARGVRGLRIGFVRHFHEVDVPADPEVSAALEAAADEFKQQGAEIRAVTLPTLGEFRAVNRVISKSESFSVHAKWLRSRPADYGQLARQRLLPGAFLPASAYLSAQRRRTEMVAAVQELFADVDVLLCASAMNPATRIEDAEETERNYHRQARTPFNVTGHPALAMMCGLSSNRLPLALQLVGRYFDERTVLRAAAAFERATTWHLQRPPLG